MSHVAHEISLRDPIDQIAGGKALSQYRQFTPWAYDQVSCIGHGIELLVGEVGNDQRDTYGKFDTVPDSACPSESPNSESMPAGTEAWRSRMDRTNRWRGAAIISSPDHGARRCLPCDLTFQSRLAPTSVLMDSGSREASGKTREAGAPTPTSNHLALAKRQCLGSSSPVMMSERSPNR